MPSNIRVESEELAAAILETAAHRAIHGCICRDVVNSVHRIIVQLPGLPDDWEWEFVREHNRQVAGILEFCREEGNCHVTQNGECIAVKLSVDPALMPMRVRLGR